MAESPKRVREASKKAKIAYWTATVAGAIFIYYVWFVTVIEHDFSTPLAVPMYLVGLSEFAMMFLFGRRVLAPNRSKSSLQGPQG